MNGRDFCLGTAVLLLACVLSGCLEFDEQTIYLEHDQANDRLLLIINYRGFYAAEGTKRDIESSREQLKEALQNQTVAFVGSWPLSFSLRELRQELKDPPGGDAKELPAEVRQNLLHFLERIHVYNGGFYADIEGRPCSAQVLIVEQISKTIPLVNGIISARMPLVMQESATEDPLEALAERMLLEYAAEGGTWVKLKGHSLIVSFPLPEGILKELRREIVEDISKAETETEQADLLFKVEWVVQNPILLWHEDSVMLVKLGLESESSVFLTSLHSDDYRPNLVERIAETYGFHLDALLARYLAEPGAPVKSEVEKAAQLMASRLTKPERIRVLIHQLKTNPDEKLREILKREKFPESQPRKPEEMSGQELLHFWEAWLREQARLSTRPSQSGK